VRIKQEYGDRAVYLAGGSDLMVHKPEGVEVAIDVRRAGIDYIRDDGERHAIGGATRLRDVENALGHFAGGMLREAVRETAPWLIRNTATLSGNIANASPAADSVPALLALGAELLLLNGDDEVMRVQDVVRGPHRNSLGDRLIREIRLPLMPDSRRGVFIKLARSKSDIAQVNVATVVTLEGDVVRDVRIALGAVAPTAMRATVAESMLEGQHVTGELLREVERQVQAEVLPISDWRASEAYRRRMSGVLVRCALERLTGLEME
jgi:CO/xanthine dehydrogenase FAD-binding subunit